MWSMAGANNHGRQKKGSRASVHRYAVSTPEHASLYLTSHTRKDLRGQVSLLHLHHAPT